LSIGRIPSVDALRGIAALSVCIFHFLTAPGSPYAHLTRETALRFGGLGVQSFFVISGFVVPLAMYRGGYALADFPRFIARRVVRLDPPYLASIVIVLALNYVQRPTIFDSRLLVAPIVVLGHLFYGFSHLIWNFDWLNSVYWTLEIEFQYYVAIALLFPLLVSTKRWPAIAGVGFLAATSLAALTFLALFAWGVVFCFGLALFMLTEGLWSRRAAFVAFAIIAPVSWVTVGQPATLVAITTTMGIAWWKQPPRLFTYLGAISFSLYLVHVPVGGRLVFAAGRPGVTPVAAFVLVVAAFVASFAVADLLWRFVERPAEAWARRIRYRA